MGARRWRTSLGICDGLASSLPILDQGSSSDLHAFPSIVDTHYKSIKKLVISVIANSHQSLRSQREGRPQEGKCKVEALNMDLSKKTLKSVDQAYKDAHLPACRLPHVLYIAQRPPFPAGQPDGLRAHSVTVGRNASISTRGLLTASTAVTVPQVAPRHVVATRFRHTEEDRPSIPKHSGRASPGRHARQ